MDDREKRETESKEANFNQVVVGMDWRESATLHRSAPSKALPNFSFYFFYFLNPECTPHTHTPIFWDLERSRLYLFSIDVTVQQGCVIFSLLPQLL